MIELNIFGILVATIIGMIVGMFWYSPILFGNAWMASIGKTPETLGNSKIPIIGSILASFLTALGVSLLFFLIKVTDLYTAICVGVILAVLIIFPAMLSDSLFCGWGNKLLLIQSGYRATSVFLMSLAMYYV